MEAFLRVFLAGCLGGLVGIERELAHKEAGLRTNILIGMGSALITILSQYIAVASGSDPARLAAQIITGIGFLGAGAIVQSRFSVIGLTTAATIWVVSAIGIGVGLGRYWLSLSVTITVIIVLSVFRYFSNLIERQSQLNVYAIITDPRTNMLLDIRAIMVKLGIKPSHIHLGKKETQFELEIAFTSSQKTNAMFVEQVLNLKGVQEIVSEAL